jgi:hypothetical protein
MIRKDDILTSIRIASPCHASWEGMTGDDRVRHCCDCRLSVYNIAGMDREEAIRLIQEAEGRLCVRLHRRNDGTVITHDCPKGLWAVRRKAALAVACCAGLVVSLAALAMGSNKKRDDSVWEVVRIHDASWRQNLPTFLRGLIDRIDPLPVAVAGGIGPAPVQGKVVMGAVAPPPPAPKQSK